MMNFQVLGHREEHGNEAGVCLSESVDMLEIRTTPKPLLKYIERGGTIGRG